MAFPAAMVKTPTFATSRDAIGPSDQRVSFWPPAVAAKTLQRGFTLIELLVVFAIGALLVALAPPAFQKLQEGSQYRDTVRSMVSDLRQARYIAITQKRNTAFTMDLDARNYGIEGNTPKSFPVSLEVKSTVGSVANDEVSSHPSIVFLPDGGSTGGSIELIRPSGSGVFIRVDWLFGQVTQESRAP